VGDWKQREFKALRDLVVAHTEHQMCRPRWDPRIGEPSFSLISTRAEFFAKPDVVSNQISDLRQRACGRQSHSTREQFLR
jgi:hypothetical protein